VHLIFNPKGKVASRKVLLFVCHKGKFHKGKPRKNIRIERRKTE